MVPVQSRYEPNAENREVYERGYEVFKKLYSSNKNNFKILNAQ